MLQLATLKPPVGPLYNLQLRNVIHILDEAYHQMSE